MPTKNGYTAPFSGSSPEVINFVRSSSTADFASAVPYAAPDGSNLATIGNIIMQYPSLQNAFINTLANRIGLVEITSRMWRSPLGALEKGLIEMGETVEEVFTNISNAHPYNPETASAEMLKREIPDIRTAFHIINSRTFYKQTWNRNLLRGAFLSYDGINRLTNDMTNSMYNSYYNDSFLATKYLAARHILDGHVTGIQIPTLTDDASYKKAMTAIRKTANNLTILNPNYNMAKVWNNTPYDDQFIILTADFEAAVGVEVLAAAFHMDQTDYIGHRILIDSFGALYNDRLAAIFADDPNYKAITDDEMELLNTIPCITVDRNFFMIFTQLLEFTDFYNGEGMEWQFWLHAWKIYSASPYAQSGVFVPGAQGVTSVTVSPATVTVSKGQQIAFSAIVNTTNFAPKSVAWSVNSDISTIDYAGMLMIPSTETADTLTVTATSTFDSTKSDTATVTLA